MSYTITSFLFSALNHPFQVRVHFDDSEMMLSNADDGELNEASNSPAGTIGFKLEWLQNCP